MKLITEYQIMGALNSTWMESGISEKYLERIGQDMVETGLVLCKWNLLNNEKQWKETSSSAAVWRRQRITQIKYHSLKHKK